MCNKELTFDNKKNLNLKVKQLLSECPFKNKHHEHKVMDKPAARLLKTNYSEANHKKWRSCKSARSSPVDTLKQQQAIMADVGDTVHTTTVAPVIHQVQLFQAAAAAEREKESYCKKRKTQMTRHTVMPGCGSIMLWRCLYET